MNTNLSSKDFAILLALEENPFMPMTELAKQLGITRITAKKRVDDLKTRDIIRNPIAMFSQHKLGLHRVNVLAQVKTISKLKKLELACDEHPYTYYRARAFGGSFQLFMQFNIPFETESILKRFLDRLRKENIIVSYEFFSSTEIRIDTYADLERYDKEMSKWDFSWIDWFKTISKQSSKLTETPKIEDDFSNFNKRHFDILRLLTADASLKQTELISRFKLSKTQAHREYNYVMNNYISKTRLLYNREIFDLVETYLVIGNKLSTEKTAQLYNALKDSPPPFRLFLDIIVDNSILLWGTMSPAQASSFAFSLWEQIDDTSIFTLDTKKSKLYWFYPENFDFEIMQWKTSKEYYIDEPIERILS